MKKTFVLNELEVPEGCCCKKRFFRKNEFKEAVSQKLYFEKILTEKFNKTASEGYKFNEDKIYRHRLFVDKVYEESRDHGVYVFDKTNEKVSYQVYMGPIIDGDKFKKGCFNFDIGCNIPGCNIPGCKINGCKNIGCSSKGGDEVQRLNFMNNAKNEDDVKTLNKIFGFREKYDQETDDYIYSHGTDKEEIRDDIKHNIDIIKKAYEEDMRKIVAEGYGFKKIVNFPTEENRYEDMLKQGMLFSSDSKKQVEININKENIKTIFLSRFDLWYFPTSKGLLRIILEYILKLITFGHYTPSESKTVNFTSKIEDDNISKLEKVYDDDLNAQESIMVENLVNELMDAGRIPVTLAFKKKRKGILGWFTDLILGKEYYFETIMLPAIKK